jgi:hypothetical protein
MPAILSNCKIYWNKNNITVFYIFSSTIPIVTQSDIVLTAIYNRQEMNLSYCLRVGLNISYTSKFMIVDLTLQKTET